MKQPRAENPSISGVWRRLRSAWQASRAVETTRASRGASRPQGRSIAFGLLLALLAAAPASSAAPPGIFRYLVLGEGSTADSWIFTNPDGLTLNLDAVGLGTQQEVSISASGFRLYGFGFRLVDSCADVDGDRWYGDLDCDGTKDGGEEYFDQAPSGTPALIEDADQDTKVQVEELADEDLIRFDLAGVERAILQAIGPHFMGTGTQRLTLDSTDNGATQFWFVSDSENRRIVARDSLLATQTQALFEADSVEFWGVNEAASITLAVPGTGSKFGVGTPAPSDFVHLKGADPGILYEETGTGNIWSAEVIGAGGYHVSKSGSGKSEFYLTPTGDLGLGTAAPAHDVHLKRTGEEAGVQVEATDTSTVLYKLNNANGNFQLQVSGSDQLAIRDNSTSTSSVKIKGGAGANTLIVQSTSKVTVADLEIAGATSCDTLDTDGSGDVSCGTDDELSEEEVEDFVGTMVTSGTDGLTYTDGGEGAGTLTTDHQKTGEAFADHRLIRADGTGDHQGSGITCTDAEDCSGFRDITLSGEIDANGTGGHDFEGSSTFDSIRFESVPGAVIGSATELCLADAGGFPKTIGTCAATSSSRKYKRQIRPLRNSLETVQALRPVRFRWRRQYTAHGERGEHFGLIAEQVLKVAPEAVVMLDGRIGGIEYEELVPLLIAAIQEQQQQIRDLSRKVSDLQGRRALDSRWRRRP